MDEEPRGQGVAERYSLYCELEEFRVQTTVHIMTMCIWTWSNKVTYEHQMKGEFSILPLINEWTRFTTAVTTSELSQVSKKLQLSTVGVGSSLKGHGK